MLFRSFKKGTKFTDSSADTKAYTAYDTKAKTYRHMNFFEHEQLTYEQRYHIYLLNKQGYNQTFIAKSMGRNKSTISRELDSSHKP
jgi:hypothetical protein